jgi:hypothetical protein
MSNVFSNILQAINGGYPTSRKQNKKGTGMTQTIYVTGDLSFPHLTEDRLDSFGNRSISLYIDKKAKDKIKAAIVDVMKEAGLKSVGKWNSIKKNEDPDTQDRGKFILRTRMNADANLIAQDSSGNNLDETRINKVFYPGCKVAIRYHVYTFGVTKPSPYGKGIGTNFDAIKFLADGEPLGGFAGKPDFSEFDALIEKEETKSLEVLDIEDEDTDDDDEDFTPVPVSKKKAKAKVKAVIEDDDDDDDDDDTDSDEDFLAL